MLALSDSHKSQCRHWMTLLYIIQAVNNSSISVTNCSFLPRYSPDWAGIVVSNMFVFDDPILFHEVREQRVPYQLELGITVPFSSSSFKWYLNRMMLCEAPSMPSQWNEQSNAGSEAWSGDNASHRQGYQMRSQLLGELEKVYN